MRTAPKKKSSLKGQSKVNLLLVAAVCAVVGGILGYHLATQQAAKEYAEKSKDLIKLKKHINEFISYTLPSGWEKSYKTNEGARYEVDITSPTIDGNNVTINLSAQRSNQFYTSPSDRRTVWDLLKEEVYLTNNPNVKEAYDITGAFGLSRTFDDNKKSEKFYYLYAKSLILVIDVQYTAPSDIPDPKLKEQVREFIKSIRFEKLNGDIPYQ